jgi:hypothetical protein
MSGFSRKQRARLCTPVDATHLKIKEVDGRKFPYIEGWYALHQANRIFGHDGWSRQTLAMERLWEERRGVAVAASYLARVRILVRAGGQELMRDGTGIGVAEASSRGAAFERAAKAAETDATKRALATFGMAFGLLLYDRTRSGAMGVGSDIVLKSPDGSILADNISAEAFCSGLRQLVEGATEAEGLLSLHRFNRDVMRKLKTTTPDLSTGNEHYVDILERLIARRRQALRMPPSGNGQEDPR